MMRTPLDGYKTYIVAAAGLLVGGLLYWKGDLPATEYLELALTLLGIGGLRHAITRAR